MTIEVSDDGAGIDVAAIKRKALERRLITPEQSRLMSEQEAINLIFAAGPVDRGDGHEHVGPRRRHGRREDEHRADRRQGQHPERSRRRNDADDENSADAGDHEGARGHQRRRVLRDSPGQRARARAARGRRRAQQDRDDWRRGRVSAAGRAAAAGLAGGRAHAGAPDADGAGGPTKRRWPTSWSCRRTT